MRDVSHRLRAWLAITLFASASIGVALGLGWWRPRSGSRLLEQGRKAYSRGDWNQAESLARQRLKTVPNDPEAVRLLARSTARLGRDGVANALFAQMAQRRSRLKTSFCSDSASAGQARKNAHTEFGSRPRPWTPRTRKRSNSSSSARPPRTD